jgi:hypothetical protein
MPVIIQAAFLQWGFIAWTFMSRVRSCKGRLSGETIRAGIL